MIYLRDKYVYLEILFGIFRKKEQKLNCAYEESTKTPCTLCAIPLGVLNLLEQLTSRTHKYQS